MSEFDVSVVVVSWNVRDLLARCLASLPSAMQDVPTQHSALSTQHSALSAQHSALSTQHSALTFEVIVVDNASGDGTAAMVRERFGWARLIETGANLGFVRGVNVGLRAARARHIAILNADTEPAPGSLAALARYLDAHPEVGLVGPRLRYPDGSTQPSRRRFPTLLTALCESTFLQDWLPNNPVLHRYYIEDRSPDETQPVDWLVGAALAVRRSAYQAAGGMDEGFFMYSEELEWARRLRAAGWRAHYVAEATVLHHEGKSSEQNLAARHIHFQASKRRYFRLVYGAWVDPPLRAVLVANYLYRIAEESAKWLLSPRRRGLRRRRLRAYRAALLAQVRRDLAPPSPLRAPGSGESSGSGGGARPELPPPRCGEGRWGSEVRLPRMPQHQYQHECGPANDCGPYSASIATRYWDPAAPGGKQVGRLVRLRLPGPPLVRGATLPYGLKRFLWARGFSSRAGTRGRPADLKRAIRAGAPTIVLVHPAGSPALNRHYRVLVGYDAAARRCHFVDPGIPDAARPEPGNHSVDYATFWREWNGGGFGPLYRRWFLPVRPRRDRPRRREPLSARIWRAVGGSGRR